MPAAARRRRAPASGSHRRRGRRYRSTPDRFRQAACRGTPRDQRTQPAMPASGSGSDAPARGRPHGGTTVPANALAASSGLRSTSRDGPHRGPGPVVDRRSQPPVSVFGAHVVPCATCPTERLGHLNGGAHQVALRTRRLRRMRQPVGDRMPRRRSACTQPAGRVSTAGYRTVKSATSQAGLR